MEKNPIDRRTSGQALIVSALVIAMLLLSTAYYVFEIQRNVSQSEVTADFDLKTIKLAAANTILSALANFTNGGQREVLTLDLDKLSTVIENRFYHGQCHFQFTPVDMLPYQDGFYASWESSGVGISSADVNFTVSFSGSTASYYSEFECNITTLLILDGTYANNGTEKTVNVTYTLYNENEPALVNDVALFYQNEANGSWTIVDSSNSLHLSDYGNGTYLASFNVNAQDFLQVSVDVHDSRDIFIVANATCRGV